MYILIVTIFSVNTDLRLDRNVTERIIPRGEFCRVRIFLTKCQTRDAQTSAKFTKKGREIQKKKKNKKERKKKEKLGKLTSIRSSLLRGGSLGVLGAGGGIRVAVLVLRRGAAIRDRTSPGSCWRSAGGTGWALRRHFLSRGGTGTTTDASDASDASDARRRSRNGDDRAPAGRRQRRWREHVRHARERADTRQTGSGHRPVSGLHFQALARRGEGRRPQRPEPSERQTVIQRVEKLRRQVEHMMEAVAEGGRGAERHLKILRVGHLHQRERKKR